MWGLSAAETSLPNNDPSSMDTTATVSTAKSLELPIAVYTNDGTNIESIINNVRIYTYRERQNLMKKWLGYFMKNAC